MSRIATVAALSFSCLSGVLLGACFSNGGGDPPPDAALLPDVAALADASTGGPPDAGGGDGTDSFAQSLPLTVGDMDGTLESLQEPRDHDFFRFEGTAGQWVLIDVRANEIDDPMDVDTVVTLYDGMERQLAENDDAVPRVNTDSELIVLLPATGTYYIEVQEYSEWDGDPASLPEGQPDFIYSLSVLELNPAAPGIIADPEMGNDAASAAALELEMGAGLVLGDYASATDIDVYAFTVDAVGGFQGTIMPAGVEGYGGAATGRIWITDDAGATTIASLVPHEASLRQTVYPNLAAGSYLLWTERPAGAPLGANSYYSLKAGIGTDNPLELENAAAPGANDTLATAESPALNPAGAGRGAFVLARLSSATDVDYFRLPVAAGESMLSVACGSARAGSGVQGLEVSVRNAADGASGTETESATMNLFIDGVAVAAGANSYVKLRKTGQDAAITGDWVRCGIFLQ